MIPTRHRAHPESILPPRSGLKAHTGHRSPGTDKEVRQTFFPEESRPFHTSYTPDIRFGDESSRPRPFVLPLPLWK
jgi:hypothetical protein